MASSTKFVKLFEPGQIGAVWLKNRIIMEPMGTSFYTETGGVSQTQIDYYAERAKGGVGLVVVESCSIESRLTGKEERLTIENDRYLPGHSRLTRAVHLYGAKIMLQLCATGGRTVDPAEGGQRLAPSAVVPPGLSLPGEAHAPEKPPREMTLQEIELMLDAFAAAAFRARMAGYDGVEIHGAHGTLVHQFLSPRFNRRTDLYGGSLENRMKFPTEVIRRIKERAGKDFPLIFRFTMDEETAGGYTAEDGKLIARYLEQAGADALDVSLGHREHIAEGGIFPMSSPQGCIVHHAEAVKKEAKVPIITVGVIREPEFAEEVLRAGKADFIGLARALLADPEWARKALENRSEDIRKCISCNLCHSLRQRPARLPVRCSVNAALGQERDFAIRPAPVKKRVLVVGSGPGGMEAARVAALRGHEVALYEKERELGGGQLKLTFATPHKDKVKWVGDYLVTQVEKLGIKVHLGVEVGARLVEQMKPDAVIIATGARPIIPDIPGVNRSHVVTAHEVLAGKAKVQGQRVAVLGGWSTGCETAEFLAEKGNEVTIIARSSAAHLGEGVHTNNRLELVLRLRNNPRVTILNEHDVVEIQENGIVIIDKKWQKRFLAVDKVVLARGVAPVRELAVQLEGKVKELYTIGDAAVPRDIASAIYEGDFWAHQI